MPRSFQRYSVFRLLVALGALAWAVWVAIEVGGAQLPVFRAVGVALALLLIVAYVIGERPVSKPFLLFQLALDVALVSVLSDMTGGLHSLFTLLYFPAIGAGAYLLRREGALWAATFAAVGFLAMLFVQHEFRTPREEAALTVWSEAMFRVFAFYLMALLTGQLGEALAQTGEALRVERRSSRLLASEHDTVLDRVRAGVLSTDIEGRIVTLNPFGRALLGDVRGVPFADLFPLARENLTWEEQRTDGARWVCSRGSLLEGGSVVVIEDVTELARMREVVARDERMSAVGRLAAGLAHEIRNPLASLSGSIQLMREDRPSSLADLALGEAERLNRLVDDFLDAARRPAVVPREVDVHAIAREVCDTFARDPRYAGRVTARCSGAALVARADPDRLRQALWNLVLNGAQAMPRGGEIRVSVAAVEPSPDRPAGVLIVVADEGVGIPDDERPRVFDPFYTTRTGGTGLGLLLVEQVAQGHGGQISIQPRATRGTEFHLWLPREAPLGS